MPNAYDPWNPIDPRTGTRATSAAGKVRAITEARREAIAALGWAPEGSVGDRYVYTLGELESLARERRATVNE